MNNIITRVPFLAWQLILIASILSIGWLKTESWWVCAQIVSGWLLGYALMELDVRFGWTYYADKSTTSMTDPTTGTVVEGPAPVQLITRSPVFLIAYWILVVFLLTSSTSQVGIGLILSMGTVLTWEMWRWSVDVNAYKQRFFLHAKDFSEHDMRQWLRGQTLGYIISFFWAVFK